MIIATDKHGGLKRLAGAVLIQARKDFDCGSDAKRLEVEGWVEGRTEGEMRHGRAWIANWHGSGGAFLRLVSRRGVSALPGQ